MATNVSDFAAVFQTKWKILGEQTQDVWESFLKTSIFNGEDPLLIWFIGTMLVILITYWGFAAIYIVIDITNRPRWIRKYKIQPDQNEPLEKQKFWKAVKQVLLNQLVVTSIFVYASYGIMSNIWTLTFIRQLPTMKIFLIDLALIALLEEPLFYYIHRLLHHRSIYKHMHKKHHEWTTPTAVMALYCHPAEHILINIGPIALSVVLLRPHIIVAWSFIFLAIVIAVNDHTGFNFPLRFSKDSVLFHDYHHEKSNFNFGVYGWLDKLHGTYKETNLVQYVDSAKIKSKKPENKFNLKKNK